MVVLQCPPAPMASDRDGGDRSLSRTMPDRDHRGRPGGDPERPRSPSGHADGVVGDPRRRRRGAAAATSSDRRRGAARPPTRGRPPAPSGRRSRRAGRSPRRSRRRCGTRRAVPSPDGDSTPIRSPQPSSSSGSTLSCTLPKRSTHSTSATSSSSVEPGQRHHAGHQADAGSTSSCRASSSGHAAAQVRRDRSEHVAPVERRAGRRELVLAGCRARRPASRHRPSPRPAASRPLSGPTSTDAPPPHLDGDRRGARCRHPGRPRRGSRPGHRYCTLGPGSAPPPRTSNGGTSWVRSITSTLGGELADHRLHDADELVAVP